MAGGGATAGRRLGWQEIILMLDHVEEACLRKRPPATRQPASRTWREPDEAWGGAGGLVGADEGQEDWRHGPLGGGAGSNTVTPWALALGAPSELGQRVIWSYWAQGADSMPDLFQLCVAAWRRLNPHWRIEILQRSTVLDFVDASQLPSHFLQLRSHQTASDAVRLALLSQYGGVWMDVSVLPTVSLDEFCWDAISGGRCAAAAFYHSDYGTEEFAGRDFVESWFLATKPGNPFFTCWRELFCELLRGRFEVKGLLQHPLYAGLNLEGLHRLNQEFETGDMDFREYLAIHAMCHRLLETLPEARAQWRDGWQLTDAGVTAFKLQAAAAEACLPPAALLLGVEDGGEEAFVDGGRPPPLLKLRTPDYAPLLSLPRAGLLDRSHLLGRLLTGMAG